MLIFECDTCQQKNWDVNKDKNSNEIVPSGWLTIAGRINNNLSERKLLYASKTEMHFCSKKCFLDKMFY